MLFYILKRGNFRIQHKPIYFFKNIKNIKYIYIKDKLYVDFY